MKKNIFLTQLIDELHYRYGHPIKQIQSRLNYIYHITGTSSVKIGQSYLARSGKKYDAIVGNPPYQLMGRRLTK